MRWVLRGALVVAVAYAALFAAVLWAMCQPPARFGHFMRHMPMILVWGALPGPRMWQWARQGELQVGDPAPDFSLRRFDPGAAGSPAGQAERVSLASHRGLRPVVLVFGSYT